MNEPPTPPKPKTRRRTILIIISALAGACLLCLAIALIYSNTPAGRASSTARAQTQTAQPTKTTKPTNTPKPTLTPIFTNTSTITSTLLHTPTIASKLQVFPTNTRTRPPSTAGAAPCNCSGPDLDCSDFPSSRSAQACFDYCKTSGFGDVFNLDSDNDGLVCESN